MDGATGVDGIFHTRFAQDANLRSRDTDAEPTRESLRAGYYGLQESFALLSNPPKSLNFPANKNVPNGITIFPGGFPLYRDGQLIGAIGISGDGVDQDDLIGISGCKDFQPPERIRADKFAYDGARLPYVKFPRDPET